MAPVPVIIDVEASGFGSESYPIEVGVARPDGERFCSLISPAPHWSHWDPDAEAVHHISRDVLATHGRSLATVCEMLNDRLEGRTVYSDGWVVDKPWLDRLFREAGVPMKFWVSPLEMVLTEEQMAIWHDTKDHLLEGAEANRHRASFDAWLVMQTWKTTREATETPLSVEGSAERSAETDAPRQSGVGA